MFESRPAAPTVKFVDEYCQWYKKLFSDVRSFEAFKYLHVGCISELKRKTLPEIAKIVGLDNQQGLHHFLTKSPWDIEKLRALRLELILEVIKGRPIILIIDETGDRKKGSSRWEIVCSSYLMVSLHSETLRSSLPQPESKFASHQGWDDGKGWKNILNNLRLIIQPFTLFNLIYPWLTVFPIPQLLSGFTKLQSIVYNLTSPIFTFLFNLDFHFSSA
ncbi:MAG: transposase [Komarekiella atlantica HA4396-MV6]|nr:transposase [Komarekiella atlantica HA4396-MV6]